MGSDSASPTIEVYVAGSFLGSPIILTNTLQLSSRRNHARKGLLDSIPEYEATNGTRDAPSSLSLQVSTSQFNLEVHRLIWFCIFSKFIALLFD